MPDYQEGSNVNGLFPGSTIKRAINVTASTTTGQLVSIVNPFNRDVIVKRVLIHIKTAPTADASIDVGVNPTSTDDSDLIDTLVIKAGTVANTLYDNFENHGTGGGYKRYWLSASYLTMSVVAGDANGLVADFYVDAAPLTGGVALS